MNQWGVEVRTKDDNPEKGKFITAKPQNPIRAYDEDGTQITDRIGNGSRATAALSTYDWEFKGKSGTSLSIQHLVITDLVEFEEDGVDLSDLPEAI